MSKGIDESFSGGGELDKPSSVNINGPFPNLRGGSEFSARVFFNGTEVVE